MCIELKIKSKHLALEPSIIRSEEEKLKKQMKYHRSDDKESSFTLERKLNNLVNHRKWNVRNEARATHLARAYIAGKAYASVEKSRNDEGLFRNYIVIRIVAMVQRYGDRKVTSDMIREWAKV
jgi:hypothetical protein